MPSPADRLLDPAHRPRQIPKDLVLPDSKHDPTRATESLEVTTIPPAIGLDLIPPEFGQCLLPRGIAIPVPEVSVYEDDDLRAREDDVGSTGEPTVVLAKPPSTPMQGASQAKFDGRVTRPVAHHRPSALGRREDVCSRSVGVRLPHLASLRHGGDPDDHGPVDGVGRRGLEQPYSESTHRVKNASVARCIPLPGVLRHDRSSLLARSIPSTHVLWPTRHRPLSPRPNSTAAARHDGVHRFSVAASTRSIRSAPCCRSPRRRITIRRPASAIRNGSRCRDTPLPG